MKQNNDVTPSTVLGYEAVEQKFNHLTNNFFFKISYKVIKPSLDLLLQTYVCSEYFESLPPFSKEKVYVSFKKMATFLKEAEINYKNQEENTIKHFLTTLNTHNTFHKKISKYFKEAIYVFVVSETANDNSLREKVYYEALLIKTYFAKSYNLIENIP